MKRQSVSSEAIKSVGYDRPSHRLEIEFNNGGLYEYFQVPLRIYDELMTAPSRGAYFQSHIRDRFRYRQIH